MADPVTPAVQAQRQWSNWREKAGEQGLPIPQEADFVADLLRVWEASDYVTQACLRHPRLLPDLLASGDLSHPYEAGAMDRQLAAAMAGVAGEAQLNKTLREFRRYQMVRIIWRDLAGWAGLDETLEDLSALADACVRAAVEFLYPLLCTELGTPRDQKGSPQPLVVLAMGKLGARELNLSSDIDLIFAYPDAGETDATRPLTNEQFFTRLCHRLVQTLDKREADGFVFRVDTRLRPFGDSGPLVMSFTAMEDYYQFQAREWERYAMIKARVIEGGREAGDRLMALLRPFVYRRYLDYGAFESLRDMKALISRELKRKGMVDNIKLGPGGIREIEFIGQAFQLIRGGREPDLQIRAIVPVLQRLAAMDYLPQYVVDELIGAYEFLRRVENRLQAWEDQQLHLLPADGPSRLRLARSMGFTDWEGLKGRLETHRRRVQEHFDRVFAVSQTEAEGDRQTLFLVWQGKTEASQARADLAQAGFEHPGQSLERLQKLRESRTCRSLSARGRQRLDRLMPLLLQAAGEVDRPDETLRRLLMLLEAVARRIAYVSLLVENPIVLSQLVRLSAASPWIAGLLSRYPLLLDELLDPRRLYSPLHRRELEAELDSLLESQEQGDLEHQMERLRQFAQSNILRVASADITGAIPLMVVSDYLTEIAEVVLGRVLQLGWDHLSARHGIPTGIPGEGTGFAVVGYGKLGGIELGYGSDLDLVFLNGSEGRQSRTDGESSLANDVFYTRLAQRMIHMLSTQTPSGVLYEVDMRLRPNGASGMLVSSLGAFEEYQRHQAWVWEHQALLRARVVAGDPEVRRRFEEIRRAVLARPREPDALRGEVARMRGRMRAELIDRTPGRFDLKQGSGGIADIEFMVQYSVLRWAHEYPDLLDFTDNIRLLEGLSRNRLLGGAMADELADAYRTFRAAYHRNALQDQPGLVADDQLTDERRRVAEIWRDLMEPG